MHSVVNSTLYVDNMNVNLIQSFSLTSNFPSKVRANCIIGTMGSRCIRVPGSFRDLSGLALRLCVSAAYPRDDSFCRRSRRGRKTSTRDVLGDDGGVRAR